MKVLVINCGSSSIKYDLFETETEASLARGLMEAIGSPQASFTHKVAGGGEAKVALAADVGYEQGVQTIVEALCGRGPAGRKTGRVIDTPAAIEAVGHRVVHGGEKLTAPAVIDEAILATIAENNELAPLHNPANLKGINAARQVLPDVTHVAVMDTAFHAAKPEVNRYYPIPYEWHAKYRIYRYGFHGSSHQYVSEEAARWLAKSPADTAVITCHLGNGCTIAAVRGGKTWDISMGFTPLEGLMMGTRSGSIDPAIVQFLVENKGMSMAEVFQALQKKSGLLGISGRSNDMRQVVESAESGDARSELAIGMFVTRCKQWIGALLAELGCKADAVVFTGGIGQFAKAVRKRICKGLEPLGIVLDEHANQAATGRGAECVSADGSPVKILVIATNEELVIARAAAALATALAQR
ncbi:MAG: Acetate kinase [Phycisphaerae bacterium]|nr:Acetate kinase [Phycisphaerae bacterium]